jgi:uncharacterized repeat protein (TIGR01451 family)
MKHLFTLFFSLFLFSFSLAQSVVYVTQNGSGNQSGGSWSDALPGTQLQLRLASAAAGSQFWIASGTYKPTTGTDRKISFSVPSGVQVYGGFLGNEASLANRTLTTPSSTTLSGDIGLVNDNSDNTYHVVFFTRVSADTRLDGVVVTGGNTNSFGSDAVGGGILNTSPPYVSSSPVIVHCLICNNTARTGGGIYSTVFGPDIKSGTIIDCQITDNKADGGGGIYNVGGALSIINCSLTGNTASISGGGMENDANFRDSSPNIINCLFANNSADNGGGYHEGAVEGSSHSKISNCSFINNSARSAGGGVYLYGSQYSGIYTQIINSIIYNNTATTSPAVYSRLTYHTITYSNIQGGFAGTGNIDVDPQFVDAANGDYRLKAGSPAINAGDPGSTTTTVSDKDLAGNPRIAQDHVDMGAYEFQVTSQNNADLSLNLRTSSRTSNLNQPVTYQLIVTNNGPSTATNVVWQNRLPDNLVYVGGSSLSLNNGVLSGQLASLAAGASATFTYQLQPIQPGQYRNAAQIIAADQPDPDSQPNSGTGDGQDDTSMDDFRAGGTTAVYASANPNQIPLPNVQSNQPTPDPTKADLSLAMYVSNRTPKAGDIITVAMRVSNAGGLTASGIMTKLTLPDGVSFVSGENFSRSANNLNGLFGSIGPNSSITFVSQIRITGQGSISLRAEVSSSDQPDPDSRPNSGDDGEDDTATVELRVRPAL